ncbi:MAG: cyclopropane fatty acyl phospholipid synthase [Burkholderiaceae bacterium]
MSASLSSGVDSSSALRVPVALAELLAQAGLAINAPGPANLQMHDPRVVREVLARWSLGLGETYMDGLWDCERLDEFFTAILRANLDQRAHGMAHLRLAAASLRARLMNLQSRARAFEVGERHYDIGNDVFAAMLDARMMYSCAWWAHADTLEAAQLAKLDLICRKLELEPGQSLLDIGCGWGGLARYAAENFGVRVTGITVSHEQAALARERCRDLPVTIVVQDYRSLEGSFDKVVSVGMFEHVGRKNYKTYFDTALRLMRSDGLFLLHTIGTHAATARLDPWIDKYIFPNGQLPAPGELAQAIEGRFLVEDWHNFGPDYDRTLMAWWERFDMAWPRLSERYDTRFYRMFKYYLLSCAGLFRSRQGQLWQLVLSRRTRDRVYRSVR